MIRRGLFAVYKPPGITSADAVERVKHILLPSWSATTVNEAESLKMASDPKFHRAKRPRHRLKVGHGGTLDRLAEGVLVIGVGEDCKKLSGYLKGSKTYEAIGRLGEETDTLDSEGVVTAEKPFDHLQETDLLKTLQHFEGNITQIIPVYSAVKQNGIRLSDMARMGKLVTPPPRQVCIHTLSLLDFSPPYFKVRVECSAGTYIRSLIRDVGEKLGSKAHVTYLCRTRQGPFSIGDALREYQWNIGNIEKAVNCEL